MVTKNVIMQWLLKSAEVFEVQQDYLTDLDREIGDADHGLNMNRGFRKVKDKLPSIADKDIGNILKTTGMVLLSSIGGASGPLNGSFFIRAAAVVMDKEELDLETLTAMLAAGLEGIVQRGKAEVGDKTMVDTWVCIVETLKQHQQLSIPLALDAANKEAEKAMQATIPMIARKGRASYLGERSVGHQDPGATSAFFLFNALCDVVSAE